MSKTSLDALLSRFRKDENEYKQLTELNTRFVNFITAVKEQSKKNEYLETSLVEQRETYFENLRATNETYYKSLSDSKRLLNDLCYHLNIDLVRERHNRILADWFAKLIEFEVENGHQASASASKPLKACVLSSLERSGGKFISEFSLFNQNFEAATLAAAENSSALQHISSTPDPIRNVEHGGVLFDQNLSMLSHISASQSSLLSCSSSASFSLNPSSGSSSSGAGSADDSNTPPPPRRSPPNTLISSSMIQVEARQESDRATTATAEDPPDELSKLEANQEERHHRTNSTSSSSISQGFMSASSSICFSLETYLNALDRTCGEMRSDYERKVNECEDLRENVGHLSQNVTCLNDSLDAVRVENLSLKESIGHVRGQIEFLKKVNMKNLGSFNPGEVSYAEMLSRDENIKVCI
jgi:hypothetical protein